MLKVAFAAALVLLSAPAEAGDTEVTEADVGEVEPIQSGLYARVGASLGWTFGDYVYRGPSNPGFGPVQKLEFETSPRGPAGDLQVALGHAVLPGFALAAEAGAAVFGADHDENLGESSLDLGLALRLLVVADYFVESGKPWHVLFGGGVTHVAFANGTNDIGSAENIVEVEPLWGPVATLGVGYLVTGGFAVDARGFVMLATEAHENDESTFRALGLLASAGYLGF